MAKKKVRHILHPIYWPNWVGIGFMRLVTFLPFDWQLKLGAALGHIAYQFASDRKHITRTNLSLCFPEQTEAQREALLKGILINSGIGLLETNYAWNGAINKIANRYHYSGLEHLQGAKDQNQPVLLLGMHFSTLDLCGAALATHIPFHVMYRRNKNPV